MRKLSIPLVMRVSALLSQEDATHPEFFTKLISIMRDKDYTIKAKQKEIRGTYLHIICLDEENNNA